MNSVERIDSYTHVPTEEDVARKVNASALKGLHDPQWPRSGKIAPSHASARYRDDLDLTLKDLSFTISSGEKVGICGRTGSGKSTTLLLLMRLLETSPGSVC